MDTVDIIGLSSQSPMSHFCSPSGAGRRATFPPRPGWQWIGAAFSSSSCRYRPSFLWSSPRRGCAQHRLFDGTRLGVVGGTLAGIVALEGVVYAWHRTVHNVGFLWRGFHQLHHSPQRVDIAGSLVFHPTEIVVQTLLQLVVTVIVLGLDPLAAALTGYFIAFNSFFQHWNVRTPQWVGYLIQRPEAHCVHHRMGVHYYNYADLTVWDMLFGTFRNPREFRGDCGFEAGADRRMGAMFGFADVNAPRYGPGSLGARPKAAG